MDKIKNIFNKLKQNKKQLLTICGLLVLVILITGTTFAVFNYSNDNAGNNDINSGMISMTYTEPSNEYVVENALPMKDNEGMNSTNYFEFLVTTTAPTNNTDDEGVNIPYEITITETNGNSLTNDKIKMYLVEVEGEKEITHTNPILVSYFEPSLYKDEGIKIGFNLHLHRNGNETITTKYRLRAWIDNDVDVSEWDTAGEFIYKFRVNVNGEAAYQGYETDLSCFTYELNDNGNYSITGYDYDTCGGKNIVIPKTITSYQMAGTLENIKWVSNEEAIKTYKNYIYAQGVCSADITWEECLVKLNATEEDILSLYNDLKTEGNELIGYDKTYLEDNGILDSLNMYANIGWCTFEWSNDGEVTAKVDTIKSFTKAKVVATSDYNVKNDISNSNNVIKKNNRSVKTIANNDMIINSIIVPENIIIIEEAFANYSITNLYDTKGKTPTSCFNYSSDSTSITIEEGYNCAGIINLRIPAFIDNLPVTTIGKYSFWNNFNIGKTQYEHKFENLYIPNTVTIIDDDAFNRNMIKSVSLSNNLVSIGDGAFFMNFLTDVDIPNSVTTIGDNAFGNNQLTTIDIPDGITHLTGFQGNKFTSIVIPSNITSIGNSAFSENQLTSVTIPDSVKSIGSHAFRWNKLTSVNIPNSVTTIGSHAFSGNQLTSVSIGNSVTTIGSHAFYDNQLTSLTIPGNVTTIEELAFYKNNSNYYKKSNPDLTRIINKTGRAFDWEYIIFGQDSDSFVTGTVTDSYGNVEIVSE